MKIANLLPVSMSTLVDLCDIEGISDGKASGWELSGGYDDTEARPVETSAEVVAGKIAKTLPAYSFTVLRVPATK